MQDALGDADMRRPWAATRPSAPPPELAQLLGAIHRRQQPRNHFAQLIADALPPPEFLSEENIGRITSQAGATAHAVGR
jgi:hypothetical protein